VRVIFDLDNWYRVRGILDDVSIGFVATMGALHEGHLDLIRRSAASNDRTVVSVFVNAPQFDDSGDLEKYPRSFTTDSRLAAEAGADFVLAPEHSDVYPDQYRYRVTENVLGSELEGAHRPGHFDGVLTVVLKLLNVIRPKRAYFGEKDYQQYLLIKGMVEALFVPVEIVPCPTVRDTDGLALSSRNRLLSQAGREQAALFPRALAGGDTPVEVQRTLEDAGFEVDYVRDVDGRRFGAVTVDGVRLIDNIALDDGVKRNQ
jgi:pantoate--beta-alanine ligase